jgi:hypothetical protein
MAYLKDLGPMKCACGRRATKALYTWRNELVRELCAQCAKSALRRQEDIENHALAELKKESA